MYTYNIWGLDNIGQAEKDGSSAYGYYYLKDHLGSTRLIVNTSGNVVGYNDFYPFGMTMPGRSMVSSADGRYQFTGKERDVAETGYDYFGARYYDSWAGRWLSVDPMAEKYPGWSPYNYAVDNPVAILDPNGLDTLIYSRSGSLMDTRKSEDKITYVQDQNGAIALNGMEGSFSQLAGTQSDWMSYMDAISNGLISAKNGVDLFSIRSDLARWIADIADEGNKLTLSSTNRSWKKGSLHTYDPAQAADIGMINGTRYSGWAGRYDYRYEQATNAIISVAVATMPTSGAELIGPNYFWSRKSGSLKSESFQVLKFKLWRQHLTHIHLGVR